MRSSLVLAYQHGATLSDLLLALAWGVGSGGMCSRRSAFGTGTVSYRYEIFSCASTHVLRYEIFSCTCTPTWCHAIRSSSGSVFDDGDDDGDDDDDDGDDDDDDDDDDDGGGEDDQDVEDQDGDDHDHDDNNDNDADADADDDDDDDDDDHDDDDDDDDDVDVDDDDLGVTGEMTLESQAGGIWSHKRDIAR